MGVTFWKDPLSRYCLQIDPRTNVEMNPKPSRDEMAARRKSWRRKFEIVHNNAQLDDPRFAKPVPRFIIQRLDKAEAAKRREQRARAAHERVDTARRYREYRHGARSSQSRTPNKERDRSERRRSQSKSRRSSARDSDYRKKLDARDLRKKLESKKPEIRGDPVPETLTATEHAERTSDERENDFAHNEEDDFAHEKDGEEMFDIRTVTSEETADD